MRWPRVPKDPLAEPTARSARIALVAAGLVVGVVALSLGSEWREPLVWAPDLVVGLAFFVVAAILWPSSRRGAQLALAVGIAWYLGSVIGVAHYWHRGPLIHLILLAPLSRAKIWPRRSILAVAYLTCLVPLVWNDNAVAVALSAGILLAAWVPARHLPQHSVLLSGAAAIVFTTTIIVGIVATATAAGDSAYVVLIQYETALLVIAAFLPHIAHRVNDAALTDLVVDLEETRSDSLEAALARALGDPAVRVGYWSDLHREYCDARGLPLRLPGPGTGLTANPIDQNGERFAILIHAASLERDRRLTEAIATALFLTATNADLRATSRAGIAEVDSSRRRILVATDDQLRLLAAELDSAVAAPLRELAARVEDRLPGAAAPAAPVLRAAQARLLDIIENIESTTLGVPPRELDAGVARALSVLAERSPVPVRVDATLDRFEPTIESALYFIAAEALSNALKHASPASIDLILHAEFTRVTLVIIDDGRGGAQEESGTGIVGMRDRVSALGGTLEIDSPQRRGTRVVARLPLSVSPLA